MRCRTHLGELRVGCRTRNARHARVEVDLRRRYGRTGVQVPDHRGHLVVVSDVLRDADAGSGIRLVVEPDQLKTVVAPPDIQATSSIDLFDRQSRAVLVVETEMSDRAGKRSDVADADDSRGLWLGRGRGGGGRLDRWRRRGGFALRGQLRERGREGKQEGKQQGGAFHLDWLCRCMRQQVKRLHPKRVDRAAACPRFTLACKSCLTTFEDEARRLLDGQTGDVAWLPDQASARSARRPGGHPRPTGRLGRFAFVDPDLLCPSAFECDVERLARIGGATKEKLVNDRLAVLSMAGRALRIDAGVARVPPRRVPLLRRYSRVTRRPPAGPFRRLRPCLTNLQETQAFGLGDTGQNAGSTKIDASTMFANLCSISKTHLGKAR